MTGEPRASALIVNYRSYHELSACLASLRNEAESRFLQIIVVDHASVDASLEPVAAAYPFAEFLPRRDNPGFGAGVNHAARRARGEFLLLVNPDAAVQGNAIRTMTAYLEAHPDTAVAGPRVYDSDGQLQGSARSFPGLLTGLFGRTSLFTRLWPRNPVSRRNLPADESTLEPMEVDWVAASCLMVRADAFHSIGGFDPGFFLYWEDADLCQRLRARGWRVVYLPSAAVIHHCGRSSRHATARSLLAFHRSAFRYYAKHRRGPARRALLPIAAVGLALRMTLKLAAAYLQRIKAAGVVPSRRADKM